ncbi:hypothetical protein DSOL_2593 [Desulfosporosinus metallidurans]|uniref:Uncharacterized protein n=1 Tax=Desulfosporosinus metallidurans TaxID=1888891 RepID=A0A1Q8QW65_9FIRM|nr:hypothetical protein DSOL_2593 [Desulfosporosinus metallidurans]
MNKSGKGFEALPDLFIGVIALECVKFHKIVAALYIAFSHKFQGISSLNIIC